MQHPYESYVSNPEQAKDANSATSAACEGSSLAHDSGPRTVRRSRGRARQTCWVDQTPADPVKPGGPGRVRRSLRPEAWTAASAIRDTMLSVVTQWPDRPSPETGWATAASS